MQPQRRLVVILTAIIVVFTLGFGGWFLLDNVGNKIESLSWYKNRLQSFDDSNLKISRESLVVKLNGKRSYSSSGNTEKYRLIENNKVYDYSKTNDTVKWSLLTFMLNDFEKKNLFLEHFPDVINLLEPSYYEIQSTENSRIYTSKEDSAIGQGHTLTVTANKLVIDKDGIITTIDRTGFTVAIPANAILEKDRQEGVAYLMGYMAYNPENTTRNDVWQDLKLRQEDYQQEIWAQIETQISLARGFIDMSATTSAQIKNKLSELEEFIKAQPKA